MNKPSYTCPGETHPISRAIHLGRLAAFYPTCRQCPHREDSGEISARQVEQLREVAILSQPQPLFHAEGAGGVYLNDLTPVIARKVTAAFCLWTKKEAEKQERRGEGREESDRQRNTQGNHNPRQSALTQRERELCVDLTPPVPRPQSLSVLLAGDGRAITAELSAAVGEGIRSSGCDLIDIGPATAACLAFTVHSQQAAGGILVGNPGQEPHMVGLQFWNAAAQPLSAGGSMETIAELFHGDAVPPQQNYGSLHRMQADAAYLAVMAKYYHALRPLVIIVDSASRPLLEYLQRLCASVACRVIPCRGMRNELSRQIHAESAHFAVSVDGDGETCRVWDERGRTIDAETLSLLLAIDAIRKQPNSSVVLEDSISPPISEHLKQLGAGVILSDERKAEMSGAMRQHHAAWGGGPSGRFWHPDFGLPLPDALMTITRLLTLLSRGDEPFSVVLDREVAI